MPDLRVLLVGNYTPDGQPSMQRFTNLLAAELAAQNVDVDVWRPPALVGGAVGLGRIDKWLRYADKFLLFPPRLRRAVRQHTERSLIVHVCDHSNAMYLPWVAELPHVVTCHDLLAVRAARGEFRETETRWTGRRLQQLVCRGLSRASRIVCDSEATRRDVRRILNPLHEPDLVYPGAASTFRPIAPVPSARALDRLLPPNGLTAGGYILHVGGDQWYKNRSGLIEIYAALVRRMPAAPPLVVAGKPLSRSLSGLIAERSLAGRVISVPQVSDADLACLYSSAAVMLFPSLAEGFGWPVLEAMACGCRVIASGLAPMTEVGGDAVTYIEPADSEAAAGIVEGVLREPDSVRQARVTAGLLRAAHFTTRSMADAYLAVYRDVVIGRRHAA